MDPRTQRPARRRARSLVAGICGVAIGLGGIGAVPGIALASAGTTGAASAQQPLIGSAFGAPAGQAATVTLISGDRVRVTRTADGHPVAQLLPDENGFVPDYETYRDGDDLYVLPSTASGVLASNRVDRQLFDVTALVAAGFDDAHSQSIRLIAQYDDKARAVTDAAPAPAPTGASEVSALSSVNAMAYSVDKKDAQAAWA